MTNSLNLQKPIQSIIVDDDPFIHDLLNDKLNQHFPDIAVNGNAYSGEEGIRKIHELHPQLVFLDVEMTDMTGFEMLSRLKDIHFQTIFITSYKHYAIKAIRFNALDYLLKPFDLEELRNAIERFKKGQSGNIGQALSNLNTSNQADQVLTLRIQEGELRLPLKEIICVEGDRNYSYIHHSSGQKHLVSKTLSSLEEILDDKGFFRCHKSFIVNAQHITSTAKTSFITLSNKTEVPVSRRRKESFQQWLNYRQ